MRMLIPTWPSPMRSSSRIFDDFDRLVDGLLQPNHVDLNSQPVRIDETEDHYLISLDMPGVNKNDVQVEVKDHQLFMKGERNHSINNKKSFIRHERSYGKFQQTLRLPETVDVDKIEAHYENGILEVILPKAKIQQGKTIKIQSGKGSFFSRLLGEKEEVRKAKDVKAS